MYTVPFVIFFLLSIAAEAGFTIYALLVYRRKLYSSQGLSPIIIYTIGVFLAVLMMFLPIYYFQYSFGDFYTFLRPLLLAVHNTMRVFILDGEFDIVRDAMQGLPTAVRVVLSTHAAILYVLAPIMTFGNVLSLFQNFQAELRYRYSCRNRPLYIMSELNRKSLMLARDIMETKGKEKPVIVFTDVYPQKNEESSELYSAAWAIHAICLSRDVRRVGKRRTGRENHRAAEPLSEKAKCEAVCLCAGGQQCLHAGIPAVQQIAGRRLRTRLRPQHL